MAKRVDNFIIVVNEFGWVGLKRGWESIDTKVWNNEPLLLLACCFLLALATLMFTSRCSCVYLLKFHVGSCRMIFVSDLDIHVELTIVKDTFTSSTNDKRYPDEMCFCLTVTLILAASLQVHTKHLGALYL